MKNGLKLLMPAILLPFLGCPLADPLSMPGYYWSLSADQSVRYTIPPHAIPDNVALGLVGPSRWQY